MCAISVLTYSANNTWESEKINNAHTIGCNAVSWAPGLGSSAKRFVSGGCDSLVKIWREAEDGHWTEEAKLEAHSDWVRDTAWAPSLGSVRQTIASCGQDRRVIIWTQREGGSWVRAGQWRGAVVTRPGALRRPDRHQGGAGGPES